MNNILCVTNQEMSYLHHRDGWIDLGRQGNVNLIFVPIDADPHSFFDISGGNLISQVDNKLGKLFHIDYVLWVI